ncbi:MAG: BON domain-containing protein, partial [Pseudomonadota bacterium]
MNLITRHIGIQLVLAIAFATQLTACIPLVVGGAAAGGAMAADRRTSGIYIEDQNIELKASKKMETNLGEYAHVNVTSFNRNVLLTGEVPDANAKVKAEALAKEITNVR